MATQALIQQLRNRITRIETSARADDGQTISSGCSAMDKLLPEGGYRRGTLIEWIGGVGYQPAGRTNGGASSNGLASQSSHANTGWKPMPSRQQSSGGCGADFLSLLTAANACDDGGALVIADRNRQFNPPAAAAIGIDLGNVVVIRPPEEKSPHDRRYDDEFFWAIDQALGCSAVAAVWGSIDQVGERWFRRFQLSAESSGTMGLFVRPTSAIGQPSWSEVRWHVTAKPSQSNASATQQIELKLDRCRGGRSGQRIDLQIDTVTGNVSKAMPLESFALAKGAS
ncbi:hypothetical protein MFFC18_36940 [Mariniblastus fucicola]|uniref:SOS cell division inhibitor n=2 Tax=Mariniblastus fucicola TaxID=980251 RepID=A0A5B9PMH7_9BACT|nr:hypothetical protein MFFC18_36940 [Mariniblastus fucicola]